MARFQAQLEGVLEEVPKKDSDGNVVFHFLGTRVVVTETVAKRRRIRTMSEQKRLTLNQLVRDVPLPGRSEPGFRGCTVIVAGNYDTDARFVEVAFPPTTPPNLPPAPPFEFHSYIEIGEPESLLLGPRTNDADGRMTVDDIPFEILAPYADHQNRIVPEVPKNEFGLPIDMTRVPLGTLVSIEGYPSTDAGPRRFIGLAVVVTSSDPGLLIDRNTPQIGITRAQGRNRRALFDVEVRGGLYTRPASAGAIAPQRIKIVRLDTDGKPEGDPDGFMTTSAIAPPGGFDKWAIANKLTPVPPFLTAPVSVQAVYSNAPVGQAPTNDSRDVDVRDDPKPPPRARHRPEVGLRCPGWRAAMRGSSSPACIVRSIRFDHLVFGPA